MTRTLIGLDSTGVACVKITKGNIDPFTEPDTNYGSFYYNSKWFKDVKLTAIDSTPVPAGATYYGGNTQATYTKVFQPPPANMSNVDAGYFGIRNSYFGSVLLYDLPLFDIKNRRLADDHYTEQNRLRFQGAEGGGGAEAAYFLTSDRGNSAWFANLPDISTNSNDVMGALGNGLYYPSFITGSSNGRQYQREVIVWNLPGDETAIINGDPLAPVAGQRSVEITKDFCRVAKPGFDVRTASANQLAFDSSRRPLAAIYADDIDLPLGTTQINLGYPVTARTLCDMFLYTGGVITFPMSQYGESLVAEYWFSGTSLFISNTVAACRCRFVVFANDQSAPTVGANKVLQQLNDGTRDVVQFLRPGSANPPTFADVILDSRWPTLSILAEGYIGIGPQGNFTPPGSYNHGQSYTVNFDNVGLLPIVKYMTVHQHSAYGKCVKFPQTLITENYANSVRYHQANSTYCVLSNNQATFWSFNGNPKLERYVQPSWTFDYVADPIIGIRYFIIGISK